MRLVRKHNSLAIAPYPAMDLTSTDVGACGVCKASSPSVGGQCIKRMLVSPGPRHAGIAHIILLQIYTSSMVHKLTAIGVMDQEDVSCMQDLLADNQRPA